MKPPVNIFTVKAGTKYSNDFVYRMKRMVEKNTTLPFNFYCLSDTDIDGIETLPLNPSLDLESYWWKICLFNTNILGPSLYFDLDIVIQNNFDKTFDMIEEDKLLVLNGEDAGQTPMDEIMLPESWPYSNINSSVIGFYPNKHQDMYNDFINNRDYNILKYRGLDRYICKNFKSKLSYLTFVDDWYYRHHGEGLLHWSKDYHYSHKHGSGIISIPFVPHSKFCIIKQTEKLDDPYFGLEEFFL